ncbi:sulfurtransferase [Oceanihabitans sp.]|nr:sulfurtransferase [Oceanihabitans sp.]
MNWRISVLALIFVFIACKQEKIITTKEIVEDNYLIEAEELKAAINKNANIKIIDFRKKEFYKDEHIIGSINIWRTDIEDRSYDYNGMIASMAQIETLFGDLGIENNDTLIIYDDNGLCDAARLWWLLQNYDFTNVKLLNGGLKSWKTLNGEVSNEIPIMKKTIFKLNANPKMRYYVSKEEMQVALQTNTVILDTRTTDEFTGKRQKAGAMKGGRIPNSMHIDWADAINYEGDKKLKRITDLETIYNQLRIDKNDPIIVYCHSGVRSAHTTFVLTQLLGYKNVKNYDGSWIEWSYFDDLPYKKDGITLIKN